MTPIGERLEWDGPTKYELRQALGKAEQAAKEQAAIREGATKDRLAREITRVRAGLERVDQRVGWLIALAAVATVLALVR